MKIRFITFASILFFLFTSCQTNKISFPIPGQHTAKAENIYNEYLKIADIYFSLEKYSDSIKYYKMALNSKQNFNAAYYKLAKAYVMNNSWSEAETMYKAILEKDSDNSSIKASLAYIYAMNNKSEDAIKIYDELLAENKDNYIYLENKISVMLLNCDSLDQIEAAKAELENLKIIYSNSTNISKFTSEIESIEKKLTPEKSQINDNSESNQDDNNDI